MTEQQEEARAKAWQALNEAEAKLDTAGHILDNHAIGFPYEIGRWLGMVKDQVRYLTTMTGQAFEDD